MSDNSKDSSRVWLITGSSAGFGRELVKAALAAGHRVVATARRPGQLADLVALGDGRVVAAELDVTVPATIASAVKAAVDTYGRIDVVVNNAGHGSVGAVEEFTMTELRNLMEVMFFGAVEVTKAVVPLLREQGSGTIVQMSSMGGRITMPGFGGYSAAKFALEGLSEALRQELDPFGVRVIIVEPGAFRTEFAGGRMHRSREIPAYHVSTGGTRAAIDAMDGTQPGDPAKAAAAIVHAVGSDNPPLRLALGNDAVDALRAHQLADAAELAEWEELSRSTDL